MRGMREMRRTRPPYPVDDKDKAVRLARTSGKPEARIARDLVLSFEGARHWMKQSATDAGEQEGLTTDDRA